jgi:hypothetical protein
MGRRPVLCLALVFVVSGGCGTSESQEAESALSTTREEQVLQPTPPPPAPPPLTSAEGPRVKVAGVAASGGCFVPHYGLQSATISLRNLRRARAIVRIYLGEKMAARVIVAPRTKEVVEISGSDACFQTISVNGRTRTPVPVLRSIE